MVPLSKPLDSDHLELFKINQSHTLIWNSYRTLTKEQTDRFNLLGDKVVNFYYAYPENLESKVSELVRRCRRRIELMISWYSANIPEKEINVSLYLYDLPRTVDMTVEDPLGAASELGTFNVPIGLCERSYSKKSANIIVTRINNCAGLLTHELCHLCNLDNSDHIQEYNVVYREFFPESSGYLTEGVNNAYATIYHSLFTAEELNMSYAEVLAIEVRHCRDLVMTYYAVNPSGKNYQSSQVFEYTVLRWIFLKHFRELATDLRITNPQEWSKVFCRIALEDIHKFKNLPKLQRNQSEVIFDYFAFE